MSEWKSSGLELPLELPKCSGQMGSLSYSPKCGLPLGSLVGLSL